MYGGNRVRQVHQADDAGGDDPVQQECARHHEERQLLPHLPDSRPQASTVLVCSLRMKGGISDTTIRKRFISG